MIRELHETIQKQFGASFGAILESLGYAADDRIFYEADRRSGHPVVPWSRITLAHVASRVVDLGLDRRIELIGDAIVEIFVEDGVGTRLLDALTDAAVRIFNDAAVDPAAMGGARFGDVASRAPRVPFRGADPDGTGLYKAVVIAPFRYEYSP